jgi:hypothetical protein
LVLKLNLKPYVYISARTSFWFDHSSLLN